MIPRHRTALTRDGLSRPVRLALRDGLLQSTSTFFDYGCGRGSDVRILREHGISSDGWDPNHAPDAKRHAADVVNVGYVINVIEDREERRQALKEAWQLAERVLIVTARLTLEELGQSLTRYGDGYLTSRGTFQKFYEHGELRAWIAMVLAAEPVAAAPGAFYVFKNTSDRESFLASRERRRIESPRVSGTAVIFERHRDALESIVPFFGARGRLPTVDEVPAVGGLLQSVPRISAILRTLRSVIGAEQFDQVVLERQQDLLVYLALARFEKRPALHRLPHDVQLDIRALFRSYSVACEAADMLLLAVGQRQQREVAFRDTSIGKCTGNALYVHVSALGRLPMLLRVYEGCARAYVGTVEGATLVKLHRLKHQVSYLSYPLFDREAHPKLAGSLVVRLGELAVDYRDYSSWQDPPVLHRKELFLPEHYPKRALFARLTRAEERLGLLNDSARIGTATGWGAVLDRAGVAIRGHRIVRRPTNQPH